MPADFEQLIRQHDARIGRIVGRDAASGALDDLVQANVVRLWRSYAELGGNALRGKERARAAIPRRYNPSMPVEDSKVSSAAGAPVGPPTDRIPEHISHNIDHIIAFNRREETKLSDAQRHLERIGRWIGRPLFLMYATSVVVLWLLYNALAPRLNLPQLDPPPFSWLQGSVSLGAFLTTIVVLITQNRQAQLEARRLDLDLQLNLLTEQKTTKLIDLLEELRRDLPMVQDRHDSVAAAMQRTTNPTQVLEAMASQTDNDVATQRKE